MAKDCYSSDAKVKAYAKAKAQAKKKPGGRNAHEVDEQPEQEGEKVS